MADDQTALGGFVLTGLEQDSKVDSQNNHGISSHLPSDSTGHDDHCEPESPATDEEETEQLQSTTSTSLSQKPKGTTLAVTDKSTTTDDSPANDKVVTEKSQSTTSGSLSEKPKATTVTATDKSTTADVVPPSSVDTPMCCNPKHKSNSLSSHQFKCHSDQNPKFAYDVILADPEYYNCYNIKLLKCVGNGPDCCTKNVKCYDDVVHQNDLPDIYYCNMCALVGCTGDTETTMTTWCYHCKVLYDEGFPLPKHHKKSGKKRKHKPVNYC